MLQINPSQFLEQKLKFMPFGQKIKEVSKEPIFVSEDTMAKVAAYKAPRVKITALLDVSQKLVINTDILVINGGYVTQPKYWDIQANKVKLVNADESSIWLAPLIADGQIHNSNFKSIEDPDCNFDIPAGPTVEERFNEIKDDIVDLKNRFFRL